MMAYCPECGEFDCDHEENSLQTIDQIADDIDQYCPICASEGCEDCIGEDPSGVESPADGDDVDDYSVDAAQSAVAGPVPWQSPPRPYSNPFCQVGYKVPTLAPTPRSVPRYTENQRQTVSRQERTAMAPVTKTKVRPCVLCGGYFADEVETSVCARCNSSHLRQCSRRGCTQLIDGPSWQFYCSDDCRQTEHRLLRQSAEEVEARQAAVARETAESATMSVMAAYTELRSHPEYDRPYDNRISILEHDALGRNHGRRG